MSTTGDVLNEMIVTLVRVVRRPGAILLRAAASAVTVFGLLGLGYGVTGGGPSHWLPLLLAAILTVPVVVLMIRRERLQSRTADLTRHPTVVAGSGAVESHFAARTDPLAEEMNSLSAAMAEGSVRTARYFPRIEAAQRAGLLAAGGPVNAPYLRDDLRVTIAALLGTVAAIPLATLGSIVTVVLLL